MTCGSTTTLAETDLELHWKMRSLYISLRDGLTDRTTLVLGGGALSLYWLYTWTTSRGSGKGKGRPPVDFESYLKVPSENPSLVAARRAGEKQPAPTDFESYLKVRDPQSVTHKFSSTETSDDENNPPAHLKPIGVLYGTEFGLSREVCEKMCDTLSESGKYWPLLMSMDDYPQGIDLRKFQVLLIACSTQGEGVPPTDARAFCSWLHSDAASKVSNLKYSVCALGDTSYTHFAQCGKDIDARLECLGGVRIAPRVDVNKEDWEAINNWISGAVKALDEQQLSTIDEMDGGFGPADMTSGHEDDHSYSKSRPYLAEISGVSHLCSITGVDDKNTIRVDIDLGDSNLNYLPGDSLGIWPQNDDKAVEEILQVMQWDGDQMFPKPTWHYKDPRYPLSEKRLSLKELLLTCYDLKSPKPDILDTLEDHAQFLSDRIKSIMADSSTRQQYMGERHVVDMLEDFGANENGCWMEPSVLLKMLRQLAPRLYSISSSPLENPKNVTLTVAVVEYEQLGKDRIGVCSTFLNERVSKGVKIPVYIYGNPDFRLPSDHGTPIIMVGPGTGVAPFRSFLYERLLSTTQSMQGKNNILFFGSRRRDQDFLYGSEFEDMERSGKLHLITAFSREQEQKVYVQHRIHEHGDLIWGALEKGGHFYICGDGEHMSNAVEKALGGVVEKYQGKGEDAAMLYIKSLVAQGRLQKDVWIS